MSRQHGCILLSVALALVPTGARAHSVMQYHGDLIVFGQSNSVDSSGAVELYFEPDEVVGEPRATYFIRLDGLDLDGSQTPMDPADDVTGIRIRIGEIAVDAPHALNIYGSVNGALREDDVNMIASPSIGEVSGIWTDSDESFTGAGDTRLPIDSIGLGAAAGNLLGEQLYVEVTTVRLPEGELVGRLRPVPTAVDLKYFPGAGFQFTFNVYSPRLLRIESTDAFSTWSLVTNLVATNSLVRSFDFEAAGEGERFYRVTEFFFVHPTIVDPPESTAVEAGATAVLQVVAEGVPEPTYQWYFKGEPIPNGTGPTLEIPSVDAADVGSYEVGVFSAAGAAYSETVQVTIIE